MAMVPEPQNGSYIVLSEYGLERATIPAASVSLSGASFEFWRYPRLCSPSPEVSIVRTASSFIMENLIAWTGPLSSKRNIQYFDESRSTTAFFIIDWQSGILNSLDFSDQPLTGKVSFLPMNRSHGRARTPS